MVPRGQTGMTLIYWLSSMNLYVQYFDSKLLKEKWNSYLYCNHFSLQDNLLLHLQITFSTSSFHLCYFCSTIPLKAPFWFLSQLISVSDNPWSEKGSLSRMDGAEDKKYGSTVGVITFAKGYTVCSLITPQIK